MTLPNVLFIGPDKSGSTWLAEVLGAHPEVFVPAAKDTYYFTRFYERGQSWYEAAFRRVGAEPVVVEVCHDYLFSEPARRRIAGDLPDVRLLVVLRRPSDRAFSSYLHMRKHGHAQMGFAEACDAIPELIDHGRYATYLRPYVETFGRNRIWVGVFDDLRSDPARFASDLFGWLGVADVPIGDDLRSARLGASQPRSGSVARAVKASAHVTRNLGLAGTVGRVKRSTVVQKVLYRAYGDDRPSPDPAVLDQIDLDLAPEMDALAEMGIVVPRGWTIPRGWSDRLRHR